MLKQLIQRHQRHALFLIVGCICFSIQYLCLVGLVQVGLRPIWFDNAIGFIVSTQVNFCLSQAITWRDRREGRIWRKFTRYNLIAGTSLVVNSGVFEAVRQQSGLLLLAALMGGGVGAVFTYLACDRFLFRAQRPIPAIREGG